jgi:hypothetical protein
LPVALNQLLGQGDAAAGGAGAVESLRDFVLGGNGRLTHKIALGLLGRNGDAWILGNGLFGRRPPLFELILAEDLGEGDLKVDRGRGAVRIGGERFDDKLGRVVLDEIGDLVGLSLLAHQDVVGRQHIHSGDAECRVHQVTLFIGEIDCQLLRCLVISLDQAKSPAAMNAVGAGLHGLKLGFGRLEGRILCNERRYSFRIHGCV